MASFPSVAVNGTLNLGPDLLHNFSSNPVMLPIDKVSNLSYQGSHSTTTKFNIASSETKCLDFREALSHVKEGKSVEWSFYVPLLQECVDHKSVAEARMIHSHMVKTGTHRDLYLMTFLINVYAKCGATIKDALKVFDNLHKRNVVTWTALITGYNHHLQHEKAIRVLIEMLESGTYPTNYTLGAVLSACSSLKSVELGKQIHGYSIKYQIESDTSVGNALSTLYSKCGRLKFAIKAFKRIEDKNVISWTTALSSCVDNGEPEIGLGIFSGMLYENVEPNAYTLTCVLSMCCLLQALDFGSQIHSILVKLGYELNLPVRNSMMYLYLKCGSIDDAEKLFDGMEKISLITWNAMISGHAQMMDFAGSEISAYQSGTNALGVYQKMNRSGLKPDLYTLSSVLTVCSSLVALEQGEQIHAQTIKTGFLSDVIVGTALVNMYNKCGSIERSGKAFVEMPLRTLISWTSMINGFSQHGQSRQALQLFEDMRFVGIKPNKITFVGVLSACSQAGLVSEALRYFEMMKSEYRITPVMDHYACMIDMFVRLGQLDEAFDFVKKMEFEPNEITWSILIAGCRSQRKLDQGFYAAEQLLKLKPKDTETYVLLLNMYLSAGRYQDVSRVRKMMKEVKLGRLKDLSWVTIKEKVYSFKPNSHAHPQSAKMYALLEDLLDKAKNIGYEPLINVDIDEDENEEKNSYISSVYHSEKLATAFGLLNTPDATPIRVLKNTSMCRDCHSFIKFVSFLTDREIVIRDKRLHKFVNGRCSCGDFGSLI